jgi:lipid-binding SYLF domain-containing protein
LTTVTVGEWQFACAAARWLATLGTRPQIVGAMKTNVLRRSLVICIASLLLFGCYREAAPNATPTSPEQRIVDRAATAVTRMRASGNFDGMEYFFENARGVLVFPRLIKASFIFGGEGGNGVLLAKKSDGSWSAPAFYSLGAGSAGFQLGYQEATVVLFFMNDAAMMSAIDKGLTLGADASIAAGTIGKSGDATSTTTSQDLYQFSDVGGLFAGVSLDGTVLAGRPKFNQSYYGPSATTAGIVIQGQFDAPGAASLQAALTPRR